MGTGPVGPYPSPIPQIHRSQGSLFEASCWRHCHLQLFCQALQLAQWVKSTWQRPSGAAVNCRNNTVETCLHRHVLWHQWSTESTVTKSRWILFHLDPGCLIKIYTLNWPLHDTEHKTLQTSLTCLLRSNINIQYQPLNGQHHCSLTPQSSGLSLRSPWHICYRLPVSWPLRPTAAAHWDPGCPGDSRPFPIVQKFAADMPRRQLLFSWYPEVLRPSESSWTKDEKYISTSITQIKEASDCAGRRQVAEVHASQKVRAMQLKPCFADIIW